MKVLSIGFDRHLFSQESPTLLRSLEYANKTEEYHVIVFSLRSLNLKANKIRNLNIYPTNSI
ncbi:MAG TPA: hypothetical protein VGC58_02760, partial [Candidatus Paceibacterota bacterium]